MKARRGFSSARTSVLGDPSVPWREGWAPWLRGIEARARDFGLLPLARWAAALAEDLEVASAPASPLEQAVARVAAQPIATETLAEGPFFRLLRFAPLGGSAGPRILLVAPCSGYAACVLAELATVLASAGRLAVLEWKDARLVPVAAGRLDAAEQAALCGAAVARFAPHAVVALSQSGDAALAAVLAARSATDRALPRALVLLGSPVVPEAAPTAWQRALARVPETTLATFCLERVGPGWPGEGRLVFPGVLQLATVAASEPLLFGAVRLRAFSERLEGENGPGCRALRDLYAIQDVPGELWLDLVARLRRPKTELSEQARAAGRGLALLTVEAGADALVGRGQTHAVQARLEPEGALRARLTLPGAGHHDLFTGPVFRALLAPRLRAFLAAAR